MVVVVPGLAHRRQRQPGEVARLVLGLIGLAAEHVAERVDAVGDVVEDEHPHRAAPEHSGQPAEDLAADPPAEEEGDEEAGHRPEEEAAVDEAAHRVALEVGGEAVLAAALGVVEEPAHVGVVEALQRAAPAAAVSVVGAVGVALGVRAGVVLSVVGDPGDQRPLDRRRAKRPEDAAQGRAGGEAAVGEEAVKADGDPEAGEQVEDPEDDQVARPQRPVPHLPAGDEEHQERHQRHQAGDDPIGGLVGDRLDRVGERRARTLGRPLLATRESGASIGRGLQVFFLSPAQSRLGSDPASESANHGTSQAPRRAPAG